MGWFKKIITIVLIIPKLIISVVKKIPLLLGITLLGWLSSAAKKSTTPSAAGHGANAEEIAAMKKLEFDAMSDEEKQAKAKNDLKLVINGAKIKCPNCSVLGTLYGNQNTPSIQGQPAVISTDKEKLNLIFTSTCANSTNSSVMCVALIEPGEWKDTGSFKMQGESPLLLKSTIKCLYGGVDIEITDCGQRSIFAYDAPTEMENDTDENSQMRIALFFDGTRNNMKNTEAREEYFKLHGKRPYQDEKYKAQANRTKAAIYENIGNKKDDSYENGYSNVALLYKYYSKELSDQENLRHSAYIDGIATGDYEHDAYIEDSLGGYAFALGDTGIVAKVEKGCAFAANRIDKLNKKGKKLKQITIDVFGFSRGAAAARSFLNELQKKPSAARTIVGNSPNGFIHSHNIPAMPRYGKLGMELEKLGVDLSDTHIIIRFAGLFDTVSSYGVCLSKEEDTKIFGLDAIRKAKNTLHLVAADEHRYFFPLVNIKSAGFNEKIFPGVHSDIGGSYVDGDDEYKRGLAMGSEELVKRKFKNLVYDGWYKKDELKIVRPSFWQSYLDALRFKPVYSPVKYIEETTIRLTSERKALSVAYSYIPLHIMCDYAMKKGIYVKFRYGDLKTDYNIVKHNKLHSVNKRLHDVVFNNAPELKFYERFELEHEIEMLRPGGPDFSFYHKNTAWTEDEIPIEPHSGEPIQIESYVTDPVLIRKIEDHNTILMLRNKYLHWSADWFELGFNPTQSGKRKIYNG